MVRIVNRGADENEAKKQWLMDLEQQRTEQRTRKTAETEKERLRLVRLQHSLSQDSKLDSSARNSSSSTTTAAAAPAAEHSTTNTLSSSSSSHRHQSSSIATKNSSSNHSLKKSSNSATTPNNNSPFFNPQSNDSNPSFSSLHHSTVDDNSSINNKREKDRLHQLELKAQIEEKKRRAVEEKKIAEMQSKEIVQSLTTSTSVNHNSNHNHQSHSTSQQQQQQQQQQARPSVTSQARRYLADPNSIEDDSKREVSRKQREDDYKRELLLQIEERKLAKKMEEERLNSIVETSLAQQEVLPKVAKDKVVAVEENSKSRKTNGSSLAVKKVKQQPPDDEVGIGQEGLDGISSRIPRIRKFTKMAELKGMKKKSPKTSIFDEDESKHNQQPLLSSAAVVDHEPQTKEVPSPQSKSKLARKGNAVSGTDFHNNSNNAARTLPPQAPPLKSFPKGTKVKEINFEDSNGVTSPQAMSPQPVLEQEQQQRQSEKKPLTKKALVLPTIETGNTVTITRKPPVPRFKKPAPVTKLDDETTSPHLRTLSSQHSRIISNASAASESINSSRKPMNRKPTIDLQPHPHPILENPHDNVVVGNSGLKLSSTTSQAGIIDEYPSSTAVGTSYARPPLVPNSKNKRANASKKAHQAPQASATTTRSNGAPKKILPSDMMKQLLEFDVFLQEERHRMSAEMKTASDPL